ncbi:E3 ubiquitin-protein ligase rnf13 [Perkinsus chesapeaki]|uniref:E3 ubiquitin-protein ligase rnf13 n=1 Tax=Perkinsus chesapeaki TaxID=330153 RepID=A0A7J6N255_PERCH|nr:E3 ubiquitin-protein ligase rnf13 [Perkinsus chesapeaki]
MSSISPAVMHPSTTVTRSRRHRRRSFRRGVRDVFRTGILAPRFRSMWFGWLVIYISMSVFIGLSGEGWPIIVAFVVLFGILPPIGIARRVSSIRAQEAAQRAEAEAQRAQELAKERLASEDWIKDNCQRITVNDLKQHPAACDDECAICLSDYDPSDVLIRLPCGHVYHSQCIDMLLNAPLSYGDKCPKCPLCRARLGKVDDNNGDHKQSNMRNEEAVVALPFDRESMATTIHNTATPITVISL